MKKSTRNTHADCSTFFFKWLTKHQTKTNNSVYGAPLGKKQFRKSKISRRPSIKEASQQPPNERHEEKIP